MEFCHSSMYAIGLMFVLCVTAVKSQKVHIPDEERHGEYWQRVNQKKLMKSLHMRKIDGVAENVIFFLGDGMGITTVTATRILKGQMKGKGVDEELVFDQFPFVSLSKTYGIDRITSDSANTATAYLCGVKANYGTLGVDGRVMFENCSSSQDPSTRVSSILKWAQDVGKWTGFVTTTRVTHATPAGLYAHTASRNWEAGSPDPACTDIAQQLILEEPGKNIRVIMGGGSKNFIPTSEKGVHGLNPGARNDSRNLLNEWLEDKRSRKARASIIYNAEELNSLDPSRVDFLLGLFNDDHLPYVLDRPELQQKYPSLQEMTEKAIKILSKSPNGFFLLVEGGSIDLAHHQNWAQKALVEGVEFDKAIGSAVQSSNIEDTLIVVTADHSHTFTVGGDYPLRGTPIIGIGGVSDVDNKTFTALGYHNGPGYKENARSFNLTQEEAIEKDYRHDTALPLKYETHGGEDVPVYARGPMAHLFHGVHDQSYIAHVMGYASCIGPTQGHCNGAWSPMLTSYWTTLVQFAAIAIVTYASSLQYV